MPRTNLTRRLATGAVSTALAVGGLAVTSAPVSAAGSAAAAYSCDFGARGTQTVPVSYSMPTLPATALAGVPTPQLPIVASLTLPAGLAEQLVGPGGSVRGAVDSLAVTVGYAQIPVSLSGPAATAGGAGTVLSLSGLLGSINPGFAGPVPVAFPRAFNLTLQRGTGSVIGAYPCSQAAAPSPGTIQVTKQTAKVKAKAVHKRIKAGQSPQVEVDVTRQVGVAIGRVYATLKGKTIGSGKIKRSGGPIVMTLAKLTAGVHTVKISYEGNPATTAASKNVKFTVVR